MATSFIDRVTQATFTLATASTAGLVSTAAQTFAGAKTFNGNVTLNNTNLALGSGTFLTTGTVGGGAATFTSLDAGSGTITTTGEAYIGAAALGGVTANLELTRTDTATSVSAFDAQLVIHNDDSASSTAGRYSAIDMSVAGSAGATANAVISAEYASAGNANIGFYTDSSNVLGKRLEISSAGNFDFQAGDLTTTGQLQIGSETTNEGQVHIATDDGAPSIPQLMMENRATTDSDADAWLEFKHGGRNAAKIVADRAANYGSDANADCDLVFYTAQNNVYSAAMTIDDSGNVGIGTTSPAQALHVKGDNKSMQVGSTTNDNICYLGNRGSSGDNLEQGILTLTDRIAGSVATAVIEANGDSYFNGGNVGIGTSSPAATLHVAGGLAYFGSNMAINSTSSNNTFGTSSSGAGSTTMYIGNATINVTSDERLKKNQSETKLNATETINKIHFFDFDWDDPTDTSWNNRNARGRWTGFSAQQVAKHMPTMINAPRKEDSLELDYESEDRWQVDATAALPLAFKAIQELASIQESQQAQLDKLLKTLDKESK